MKKIVACIVVIASCVLLITSCASKAVITFDTRGGEPLSSVTLKGEDGILIEDLPTAKKTGYSFVGWYLEPMLKNLYVKEETKLKGKVKLYAKYEPLKYTLSFVTNGGTSIESIETHHDQILVNLPVTTYDGHKFIGWYSDSDLLIPFDIDTPISKHLTIYAKWEKTNYRVIFVTNGGTPVSTLNLNYQDEIILPTSITKEGYIFDGWYTDSEFNNPFTYTSMPLVNLTAYAKWIKNHYDIYFQTNSQHQISKQTFTANSDISNLPVAEKAGYTFDGWYTDPGLTNKLSLTKMPTNDLYLYAKYKPNTYTVTVVMKELLEQRTFEFKTDEKIEIPLTKFPGYKFVGYYMNLDYRVQFYIETMPSYNLVVYAKYVNDSFTIDFVDPLGNNITPITKLYNAYLNLTNIQPTHEGYIFEGLYLDSKYEQKFDYRFMPATNLTLYLKWTPKVFTITYNDSIRNESEVVNYNYLEVINYKTPEEVSGYTFEGWYFDQNFQLPVSFQTMPALNIVLHAKYLKIEYTVSVDTSGGSNIDDFKVLYDTLIELPTSSYKEGNSFSHFVDEQNNVFDITTTKMPARNLHLTIVWEKIIYKIEFVLNISFKFDDMYFKFDEDIIFNNFDIFKEYQLENIYTNSSYTEEFSLSKMPSNNLVLYLKYNTLGLVYEETDAGYLVSKGYSSLENVVIPQTYKNKPVIGINENGFKNYANLKSIVLPSTITLIGKNAFYNCYNLESISINSVNNIDDYAFYNCRKLSSVTLIGVIERIGKYAFYNTTNLLNINIPTFLKAIDDYAFYNSGITSFIQSGNLIEIGKYAFSECKNLNTFDISNTHTIIINEGLLSNSINLSTLKIHSNTRYIGKYSFSKTSITTLNLPSSIEEIDFSAFLHCSSLTSLDIDNTYYKTLDGIVYSKDLTKLHFVPNNLPFTQTYSILSSVNTIKSYAFNNVLNLNYVFIADNVTTLEDNAFYACYNLTTVLIGSNLSSLGANPFSNCYNLESISVFPSNNYFSSSVDGILYSKDETTLIKYPPKLTNTSLVLPDTVTTIYYEAFMNNIYLREITATNVRTIHERAFFGCSSLEQLHNLLNLEILEKEAFMDCVNLTSINISNVLNISDYAFYNCTSLQVISHGGNINEIGQYAFYNCTSLTNFEPLRLTTLIKKAAFMHTSLVNVNISGETTFIGELAFSEIPTLKEVSIGRYVMSIEQNAFNNCISLHTFSVNSNNIYFTTNEGVLYNKAETILIQFPINKDTTTYTILPTVKVISDYAFYKATKLTSIITNTNLEVIGDHAFDSAVNLELFTLPERLKIIGTYAFKDCVKLNDLTIHVNIDQILAYAFENTNCNIVINGFSEGFSPMNFDHTWYLGLNGVITYNQFITTITIIYNDNSYNIRAWYNTNINFNSLNLPFTNLYLDKEYTLLFTSVVSPLNDITLYAL